MVSDGVAITESDVDWQRRVAAFFEAARPTPVLDVDMAKVRPILRHTSYVNDATPEADQMLFREFVRDLVVLLSVQENDRRFILSERTISAKGVSMDDAFAMAISALTKDLSDRPLNVVPHHQVPEVYVLVTEDDSAATYAKRQL